MTSVPLVVRPALLLGVPNRITLARTVIAMVVATYAFRTGEPLGGDAELDNLTPREREVLQLIARGYRYKEIAARLHLSIKTVESHVSSVLRKLQLTSRYELSRWAQQRRLV